MKISANQLPASLKKSLSPCYLVTGDEPLLVEEALDAIRDAAKAEGYSSRDLLVQATGFDWSELTASAGNLSLFAERRIIELRLPTGKPGVKGSSAIADFAANAGDDNLFIVVAPKPDSRSANAKWIKALAQYGCHVQIWPVDARELPSWVRSRMQSAGLNPDPDAVRLIADRVEGNLLAAQQEIEKLRLILGEGAVSGDDVNGAVADASRYDVYKLVDAAVGGNAKRALRILQGLQAEGLEPVIVFWALARELRSLTEIARTVAAGMPLAEAMQKARVWRNRQRIVRSAIARLDANRFFGLIKLTRHGDAAAKGQGPGDPWQIGMQIVLGLAGADRRAA